MSTTRVAISCGVGLHHDPRVRVQRRQVVKLHLVRHQVRILVVDRLDAQQGEIALVLFGRADLAGNGRTGLQAEPADLAGRDVDVVGAGQVVIVGAAQKPEPVGQDLQRSLAVHQPVHLHAFFQDAEDQVLLLHARHVGDVLFAGLLDQLGHAHLLQFGDVDLALLDFLVAIVGLVLHAAIRLVRQLFGQRQGSVGLVVVRIRHRLAAGLSPAVR